MDPAAGRDFFISYTGVNRPWAEWIAVSLEAAGYRTVLQAFDFRPGGVWRFVMHGPDGRDYDNRITFDEIVRPSLLRYHHGGGEDVEPVQFRTTVTFEDLAGGRTRITLHAVFPSAEEHDRVVCEHGAAKGAEQTLARLADYVATMS